MSVTTTAQHQALHKILKNTFGYDRFRPMQMDIIEAVCAKKDVVVLMPTGGGKSICYQVPALALPGLCVVISPLISLMQDQVEALKANGVAAAFLNSSQSAEEQMNAETMARTGRLKLLYVSPEKLLSVNFMYLLQSMHVSLFAVDEAHCISAWGHDFRPEYTQLARIKKQFPQVPVIALTATADKLTRKDIAQQLHLQNPGIFISSFDRPNLSIDVRPGVKRLESLMRFLESQGTNSGIIYCLSRGTTESLAQKLQQRGFAAMPYHAGLSSQERAETQDAFLRDDIRIVCATVAFGMGIDKSNVRYVVHYNLPKNVESYYQEIGRAGRDGLPSKTILYYSYADMLKMRSLLETSTDKRERLELQIAKLERMQQFAEANTCRRQILLNYFNETLEKPCGNCDVCRQPRQTFDGTVIAQKALSAVARAREKAGANLLIDILRGARNKAVLDGGYDKIKTYGAGRDLSFLDWRDYIQQLVNAGLLEIAYDDRYYLKLTARSKPVLLGQQQVPLVKFVPQTKSDEPGAAKNRGKAAQFSDSRNDLFEHLRNFRKQLADQKRIAPDVIFTDTTLREMSLQKPTNKIGMLSVTGVGAQKYANYGEAFINAILEFMSSGNGQNYSEPVIKKVPTKVQTLDAYMKGLSPDEIAMQRNLNPVTIYSHLADLYEEGHEINIHKYLPEAHYQTVYPALAALGANAKAKELHDYLKGTIDYHYIRLSIARFKKETRSQMAGK